MKNSITTSGQLGPVLKQWRIRRGLSQAGLGEKLGLSQERISRIESNPESTTFDRLLDLFMVLDIALVVQDRKSPMDDSAGDEGEQW